MPRQVVPLTAKQVQAAQFDGKPRKLFDGAGLYLHIQEGGRYWRLKYRAEGKPKILALGTYPDVSLADARRKREEARRLVSQGTDPLAARKAEKSARRELQANSLEATAREWWQQVHSRNVVASHAGRNLRRLELHIFPKLSTKPIREITAPMLLAVLREVADRERLETARRVLTVCGQVFRYGIQTGRCDRDVAADLRDALPTPKTRHHPALLKPEELAPLLRAIWGYGGQPATRAALQLLPALACRPGELRTARWEAFDLDGAVWHYRASKGGPELLTPLPSQVVEALRELEAVTGPAPGYVFASLRHRDRPMSENTVNAALHQMGYKSVMVGHGFRACFRTIGAEVLGYPPHLLELQLGHAVRGPLGAAYDRTSFLPERRELMQGWSDYLDRLRDGRAAS